MFIFLTFVNSTEEGHICRPPQLGEKAELLGAADGTGYDWLAGEDTKQKKNRERKRKEEGRDRMEFLAARSEEQRRQ